jgi:hypothetical protein
MCGFMANRNWNKLSILLVMMICSCDVSPLLIVYFNKHEIANQILREQNAVKGVVLEFSWCFRMPNHMWDIFFYSPSSSLHRQHTHIGKN